MQPIVDYLRLTLLDTALILAFLFPFLVVGMWRVRSADRNLLVLIAILILVHCAFISAPDISAFPSLHWNWQGKILEIVWSILFIVAYRRLSLADIGLTLSIVPGSFRPILLLTLLVVLPTIVGISLGNRLPANTETLLFQMTMPGLGEEFVYRGVFQSLFNRAFGKPRMLWGAQVGFGLILTALLFGFGHLFFIDKTGIIHFHVMNMLSATGVGFALGWIRERSGSLLPCVVVHNLFNTLIVVGSFFLR